ncbi:RHS repeat-associated core domain-containing protein [Flavobacterium salilacus]|uniref:RHS repeat-associated core domain-containing protein n=1 Tax=Flavobacterium sp. SaA2.13 TaxID=2691898 RepID=UPI0021D2568C
MEEDHYYPFGLKHKIEGSIIQPIGNVVAQSYKYNGKELQDELGLDWYDYHARNYDPAIGRWFNIDPLAERYYQLSTYTYVGNMPTIAIDPDGKRLVFVIRDKKGNAKEYLTYRNGNFWHANGKRYNPGKESLNKTMYRVLSVYRRIESSNDKVLKRMLNHLEKSDKVHYMQEGAGCSYCTSNVDAYPFAIGKDDSVGTIANWNLRNGTPDEDFETVVHEMRHQFDWDTGNMGDDHVGNSAKDPSEIRAVWTENRVRKMLNLPLQTKYGTEEIDPHILNNPPNNENVFDEKYDTNQHDGNINRDKKKDKDVKRE